MASKIDIGKTQPPQQTSVHSDQSDRIQDMESAISRFFYKLAKPNDQFNAENAFDELLSYITNYDRILYSTISNIIYAQYDNSGSFDPAGTLLSNLGALVKYSEDSTNIANKKMSLTGSQTEKNVDDTRKAVIKIWDHVTLASQQYTMLKQSDEEYDDKFKKRIASYKEEMSRDMNSQMITMVGIFTALAFLVFGSISSLDGVFENTGIPLFKTLSIGLIWGLCISNMIFVFLYCVGKMTKTNIKANNDPNATIFHRYPVVWWTNLVLVGLLLLAAWGYYIQSSSIGNHIILFAEISPLWTFIIGSIIVLALIIAGVVFLSKKTKSIS